MKRLLALTLTVLMAGSVMLTGCGGEEETSSSESSGGDTVSTTELLQFQDPAPGSEIAIMKTSMGDITLMFFPEQAPKAVENFVTHAKNGYYNGLTFHRVINDFMIQGGDPSGNGTGGASIWDEPFEDEFTTELHNFRGALSMANAGPGTNGSQFFIVQKDTLDPGYEEAMRRAGWPEDVISAYVKAGGTPHLDGRHTVFGFVTDGMDVVDAIAGVKTGMGDRPLEDVVIRKITIKKAPGLAD